MKRPFVFLLVSLAAVGAPLRPAIGHEGEGKLVLVSADPAGPSRVRYVVHLTYLADGHAVPDATVTAVGEGPGAIPPQPLAPTAEEGNYEVTLAFPQPGTWAVRFTAVTPPATLEHAQQVAPPPTTTTRPSTSSTTQDTPATTRDGNGSDEDDGDGGSGAVPVVAGVAVAAVGLGALPWLRARRRRSQGGEEHR